MGGMSVAHEDCVCVYHVDKNLPVPSIPSLTFQREKEIQRICLHSRNARINWEDCVSVPRAPDSCFTRKMFGWTFPLRVLYLCQKTGRPHLPGRLGQAWFLG